MDKTVNLKHFVQRTAAAGLLLAASGSVVAQHDSPELVGDGKISTKELLRLVDNALPHWDESILDAHSDTDPVAKLEFDDIVRAVKDEPLRELPPDDATQFDDGERALKLAGATGKLRYVNRSRSWTPKTGRLPAIAERDAEQLALQTFVNLGFPRQEMSKALVRTQIAAGAKAGATKVGERFEMYRLVLIPRNINGLPVYGSDWRVAISNTGEIQRLGANWPVFALDAKASLQRREDVVTKVMDEIMDQDPDSALEVRAALAYAQVDSKDFKPVAVVAVNSLPTPYQLLVELTEPADIDDSES